MWICVRIVCALNSTTPYVDLMGRHIRTNVIWRELHAIRRNISRSGSEESACQVKVYYFIGRKFFRYSHSRVKIFGERPWSKLSFTGINFQEWWGKEFLQLRTFAKAKKFHKRLERLVLHLFYCNYYFSIIY